MKATLPFGQVPAIEHGDVKMAQGWGCFRYAAKQAGLLGDNDAEYALSEMLTEEAVDLYNIMNKANYADDKVASYAKCIEDMKPQLAYLEKLLPGGDSVFFKAGDKRLAGGIAIACSLDIACLVMPEIAEWMPANTPKLDAFLAAMRATPALATYSDMQPYFKRA